ncbi:MAG TPA: hypothetical protein VLV50_09695 [Stellaceae bacterium]|nr:hypothetical protein [Stellaceae bacterium]
MPGGKSFAGRAWTRLAIGMVAAMTVIGIARADSDGITNSSNVPQPGNLVTCSAVGTGVPGLVWTPSAFSFDISWIDDFDRAYFLADRSHGIPFATSSTGNPNGGGDIMEIDINSVNLTSANTSGQGTVYLTPPKNDPFAGIACDQNTAFGGTSGVGRNEITGPNGAFTVNHAEVWAGDGPSYFQPGQGHGTVTMSAAGTCGVAGVTCTYSGTTADYAADKCDSSVRVFDLISGKQTDHIDVGGCFRTDEGAFDPVDQVAVFANPSEQPGINSLPLNQSAYVTFISTISVAPGQHHQILKQINFDGTNGTIKADMGIEQAVYSKQTGFFYISIPGASSNAAGYVTIIDPTDRNNIKVVGNYTLAPHMVKGTETFCAPNGGALGPNFELFLGCSSGPVEIIDIRDGSVQHVFKKTAGGCDEVAFNPGDDHFLGACTDSNSPSTDNLDIIDALPPRVIDQQINTHTAGAHSVAADAVTVSAWQPAAAASAAGPSVGGLCGATPCVLIYTSSGGDDASVFADEKTGTGSP